MTPLSSRRLLLPMVFFLMLMACAAPPQAEEGPSLEPCKLTGDLDAQCGSLTVPENRDDPAGREIDIHFAVVPAESSLPEPDPVFMLAGGPGQAATEAYAPVVGVLDDLNQERDIVLVDQRGTGQSNPLECPKLQDLSADAGEEEVLNVLEACRETLAQRADLTQYITDIAMQDLDDARQALGYEQINLIGGSYGTRAALVYMRLFPENVRSVVLSAVVSPELVLQLQAPADGQRALRLLFERCNEDAACRETFPDFERTFTEVHEALGQGQEVTFEHPVSGARETLTLDEEEWMQGVFNLLYSPELASLLPLMVQEIAQTGNYGPLLAQIVALTEGVIGYQGMFYTVACSEDAPLIELQTAQEMQEGSPFPLVADELATRCENWPRAQLPASFREPLQSDIPTLLLSGEADPITPPQYAEQVAARLSNSLQITLPGFGHDVLLAGCMPAVVTDFVEAGTVQGLDTACVQEIVPPPFFVSPVGPRP